MATLEKRIDVLEMSAQRDRYKTDAEVQTALDRLLAKIGTTYDGLIAQHGSLGHVIRALRQSLDGKPRSARLDGDSK